jgi:hypothetical protein
MSDRILGYVMARNEWPLIGLSVTHALGVGVDEILVVDHSSEDETNSGLKLLQKRFPGRIKVLRLEQDEFLQEATSSLISSLVKLENYDWVYVFDADEFLMLPNNSNLKAILSSQLFDTDSVRYSIDQWVSPNDFDDLDIFDYKRIQEKSVPILFTTLPGEILEAEISKGNLNFFDVEFPSKIIVRPRNLYKLGPGSHVLRDNKLEKELQLSKDELVCGHLPLLSKRRLNMKAAQGKDLIDNGFPESHGWQSQMISRLKTKDELESFWKRHSSQKSENLDLTPSALPVTVVSTEFLASVDKSVKVMLSINSADDELNNQNEASILIEPANWGLPIGVINQMLRERDAIAQERDAIAQERDAIAQERDAIAQERDAILMTKTFRWTKPLRDLLTWATNKT